MHAGLVIATVMAMHGIQNPVQIAGNVNGTQQTYNVDCWSRPRVHGTWLAVIGSGQTMQQALIYTPSAADAKNGTMPSILYCVREDGTAGVISGAPAAMMLPRQTRVAAFPTLFVQPPEGALAQGMPYDSATRVHADASGVVVWHGAHRLTIFPRNSKLIIDATPSYEYFPPGERAGEDTGCIVSYAGSRGEVRSIARYPLPCSGVKLP